MKIIQNTIKIEKKSQMSKKKRNRVGPKKVGFPENKTFFFSPQTLNHDSKK